MTEKKQMTYNNFEANSQMQGPNISIRKCCNAMNHLFIKGQI